MKGKRFKDKDGGWLVINEPSGVTVAILEKPSKEYIASLPPYIPEPEPRDYLAEIDQLKLEVEALKTGIAALTSTKKGKK